MLSLSSSASWIPVDAPEGTEAVPDAVVVVMVTSIVGLPRLSRILLARMSFILDMGFTGDICENIKDKNIKNYFFFFALVFLTAGFDADFFPG